MRSEYKFPKATVGLMTVILGVVLVAIEKAKAISESVAPTSTAVGPIQPMHFSIVVCVGVVGRICVSAERWSGRHCLLCTALAHSAFQT